MNLFLKCYEKNLGKVVQSAKAAKIGWRTFYNWRDNYPCFADSIRELDESFIDLAEGELYKLITGGDKTAIIFYLKCKAKHRGYIDRVEENQATINAGELADRFAEMMGLGEKKDAP